MTNSTPTTKTSPQKARPKHIVNVLKKDNGTRKVKKVAQSVQELKDPRTSEGAILYPLDEILFTALAAVLCGSESCYDFETFGKTQISWLQKFFPFKNGTPSHDTFQRVVELLCPNSLEQAYRLVIENLKLRTTKHLAIDGKASRGY